jgi:hypothetical protein
MSWIRSGAHSASVLLLLNLVGTILFEIVQARLNPLGSRHHSILAFLALHSASTSLERKWVDVSKPLRENDKIRISGAWIDGEYGKPETWREIMLVNTAIFTTPAQLDQYVAALRKAARA